MSMRSSRPILSNAFCAAAMSIRAKFPFRALAMPLSSSMALTLSDFSFPFIRNCNELSVLNWTPGINFSGKMTPAGSIMRGSNPFRPLSFVFREKSRMPLSCKRSVPMISTTSPLVDSTPYPSMTGYALISFRKA